MVDVSELRNDLAPILQDVKNIKQNIEDKILNSVLDRQGAFEDPVIAERQRLTIEHLKNTKDITLLDKFLYAWTKSSNPMAAILGKLTRDRQDERSQLFRQAQIEIGIAHEKLLEAGITDTSFVYDEYGYIESEYDWSAYYVDRREKIRELQNIQEQKRLSGLEFRNLLDEWENEHLEDLVVDDITGRTEKVPSKKYYAKELPNWTSAQREYYDTMLKIKGDSLLYSYLKYHSYWYIEILLDENKLEEMIKEMKKELKLTPEDKLEDLSKKLELFSSIMGILS